MHIHVFIKTEHQQSCCSFLGLWGHLPIFDLPLLHWQAQMRAFRIHLAWNFTHLSWLSVSLAMQSGGNRVTPLRSTCHLSSPLPVSKHVAIMSLVRGSVELLPLYSCCITLQSNHFPAPCATVASARLQLVHRCRQQPPGHLPTMDFEFQFVNTSN